MQASGVKLIKSNMLTQNKRNNDLGKTGFSLWAMTMYSIAAVCY